MVCMYASGGSAGLWMYLALGIFILASVTDFLDGYIARHYNQVSDFGKFLDPLADKLLTIAAMCIYCEWGIFPAWALMIILTREFAVTGLRLVAVQNGWPVCHDGTAWHSCAEHHCHWHDRGDHSVFRCGVFCSELEVPGSVRQQKYAGRGDPPCYFTGFFDLPVL